MADVDLMLQFLLQMVVVLSACRLVGWFGKRFLGQAQVTMEMLTGIILGPSLFGLVSPLLQQKIFPLNALVGHPETGKHPSMSVLYIVAQIGLVLYMFCVGLEFDLGLIKTKAKAAVAVSAAGILFPFLLGCGLFFAYLSTRTDMVGQQISPAVAGVFVGAAMSITAFPMLARLIHEAGIRGTAIGTLTISAGAIDDVAAWSLLAVVLAASKGNPQIAIWAIGGGLLFVTFMLSAIKPLITWLLNKHKETELSSPVLSSILILLGFGAYFTDAIGIHAVFGAFVVGVAIPKGHISKQLIERIEPIALGLFLPFFFVYSGLNTRIASLSSAEHWLICALVLGAAIIGKLGGCYIAARAFGERHRQALGIGILMNSRGMMGLLILNIGLQQKIITVPFFTIMVITAVITTVMAAPLFRRIYQKEQESVPVFT